MRAVDTNVLVRLLARDDPKQLVAAEDFVGPGAWISHLVLMETVWVLDAVYGVGRDAMADGVEMLLDHETLVVDGADVVRDALSTFRKVSRVSFSDCLILHVARKAGHSPLGTFDRALGKAPGAQRL